MAQGPLFQLFHRWLVKRALGGVDHARVLDIGSGVGSLVFTLAESPRVTEAVGVDLSGEMIEYARMQAEERGIDTARFLQADGADLPFEDNAYDVVISTLSLHHWQHPGAVLAEIYRVMAPGGRLIIADLRRDANPLVLGITSIFASTLASPELRATGEPIASFQSAYTPAELALLAYKCGWSDPRLEDGPFWLLLTAEKPVTT